MECLKCLGIPTFLRRNDMNRFTKETIWLFGCLITLLSILSCEEDKYHPTIIKKTICEVPKFYNEKQGFYEGEVSFISHDTTSFTFTCPVEFGNYENPIIVIHNFPVKLILDFAKNDLKLAEEISEYQLSESIFESNLNINFKYWLYGNLTFNDNGEPFGGPSKIDSTYPSKSLYFQVTDNYFEDSIYNEDKTQKMKFEVAAENYENNIITFILTMLEINDKRFPLIGEYEYRVFARIKVGDEKQPQITPQFSSMNLCLH